MTVEEKEQEQEKVEDVYFYGYNMLLQILKEDDPKKGLGIALYLAKIFLNAEDVVLYKMGEEDVEYKHIGNQTMMKNNSTKMTETLNNLNRCNNLKDIVEVSTELYGKETKYAFLPIATKEEKYVLAISDIKITNSVAKEKFFEMLKEAFNYLFQKNDMLNTLKNRGEIDILTKLYNRTSYTEKLKELDRRTGNYVYSIFDLLRLKFINDQYGHEYGDVYIEKTAEILQKYYPKYKVVEESTGLKRKVPTGNYLYRIGGDEFVLITTSDSKELVDEKNIQIAEEVRQIDLGIEEPVIIGIDYGTAERTFYETSREIAKQADDILRDNKSKTYKRLNINRRK